MTGEQRTAWFTFGFDHVHVIDGRRFDRNTVVKITAADPRAVMVAKFGRTWAFEYCSEADIAWFTGTVIEL